MPWNAHVGFLCLALCVGCTTDYEAAFVDLGTAECECLEAERFESRCFEQLEERRSLADYGCIAGLEAEGDRAWRECMIDGYHGMAACVRADCRGTPDCREEREALRACGDLRSDERPDAVEMCWW